MAVDKEGNPITNIITWADLRSTAYAQSLKNSEAGKRIYEHTGTPVHPMSPLCKLLWLKENAPDIFSRAARFISMKEYLFFHLFEKYFIDHSVASGTGLFDIGKRSWHEESLSLAGISKEQLSEPVPTTYIVRGLKKDFAKRLHIDAELPFIIGASDGCLANMGSNAINPGDMSITIGTSGAVRMITDAPKIDRQQRTFNYILTEKIFVAGGPSNNGLNLLKWYGENFLQRPIRTGADINWFVKEASKAAAGSEKLIFLPYVQGERAPVWDALARGVFFGVQSKHTQAHFMRAIIEGINYTLYQIAKSVEETVGNAGNIFASGGFMHARLWLQMLSDLFGKQITVTSTADASTTGAALLGLQALGILYGLEPGASFVRTQEIFEPGMANHQRYAQLYTVYASLYESLREHFYKVDAIPES
jgi:gluconokinase